MGLLDKLLGKDSKTEETKNEKDAAPSPQEYQPHENDMCCGGCGGHGHGRKDKHENA